MRLSECSAKASGEQGRTKAHRGKRGAHRADMMVYPLYKQSEANKDSRAASAAVVVVALAGRIGVL